MLVAQGGHGLFGAVLPPHATKITARSVEVNRRVGKGRALRAVPTIGNRPRGHGARNQACMSLERLERARLCPPYKRDPVSSGPAVVPPQEPQELQNIAHQGAAVGGLGTGS